MSNPKTAPCGNVIGGPRDGETWNPGQHSCEKLRVHGHIYKWDKDRQRWRYVGPTPSK